MIRAFAISEFADESPAPPLLGLRVGQLLVVAEEDAVVEDPPTPEALWRHEEIVEQLMAEHTVLPVRFGGVFADEGQLRRTVADRHDELLRTLERVRGRVEMGLRVLAERERASGGSESGRDYLLGKLEARKRADALHRPLAGLAAEARLLPPRAGELVRAAYLLDRSSVGAFRDAVARLDVDDGEVVLTGPWPPYSFVSAPLVPDGSDA